MSSDPLAVLDVTRMGDARRRWRVECRESAPCLLVPDLYGLSAAVNAAIERLEAIHQAAHRIEETP